MVDLESALQLVHPLQGGFRAVVDVGRGFLDLVDRGPALLRGGRRLVGAPPMVCMVFSSSSTALVASAMALDTCSVAVDSFSATACARATVRARCFSSAIFLAVRRFWPRSSACPLDSAPCLHTPALASLFAAPDGSARGDWARPARHFWGFLSLCRIILSPRFSLNGGTVSLSSARQFAYSWRTEDPSRALALTDVRAVLLQHCFGEHLPYRLKPG